MSMAQKMPQNTLVLHILCSVTTSKEEDLSGSSETSWTGQKIFWYPGPRFCHFDFYRDALTGSIVVSVMALYIFDSLEGAPVVDLSNAEVNLNNTSYIYVTDPETQEENHRQGAVLRHKTASGSAMTRYRRCWSMLPSQQRTNVFWSITAWTGLRTIRSHPWILWRFLPCTGRLHHHPAGHQEPDRQ